MKKTIVFMVMALLCLFFKTVAQDIGIRGRVITQSDSKPLPGATIRIRASNIVTQTDVDGNFRINTIQRNGILLISYTGYETIEIPYKAGNQIIEIELKEERGDLNEVVVIGYGQTTRKLNTGSVSSISAKQIEQQPVTNVLSALAGRMPGVFVQTTNGLPGGNIKIQIRGKGSIATGTDPLYIIDGVPYEGNAPNATNDARSTNNIAGTVSPLNNINPTDIESITVLKDADATSIYGSRGANGVLLITTKRAGSGDTKLNVNVQQGFSRLATKPKLMNLNEYLEIKREAFANDNRTPSSDPTSSNYSPDLTVWSQTEGTDWVDYLYGNTAISTDVQAKLSGGKENTSFSVSSNYRHESAILRGKNNFARGGLIAQIIHSSSNHKFNLRATTNLSISTNDLVNPVLNMDRSYLRPPNFPLYLKDGSVNWYGNSNIMAELNAKSKTTSESSIASLNMSYKVMPELILQINTGYTKTAYDQKLIFPSSSLPPGAINSSSFGLNNGATFIIEPQIDYTIKFKGSVLSLLTGATFQNRENDSQYIKANDFKLESLMEDLGSAGQIETRQSTFTQYRYASVFGRISYNLQEQYLINATLRRDGSSRFGPGAHFGTFGSVGGAWIFSNHPLVKQKLSWLSHGKLRASYGSTGNDQIGDYQYLSTYSSPGGNLYQDVSTIRPSRISNDNFHWETTRKTDVGLELGFISDRIFLSADYYLNRSKDQLVYYNIPQITGFADYQANLPAVIENKGWEFALESQLISKDQVKWSINANITFPRNKLIAFKNLENSGYASLYEIGYDITRIKGYKSLGIDRLTGKMQYAGKDGLVSAVPFDNFTLGKLTPDYYGGFGTKINFKGIELNLFTQFVKQVSKGDLKRLPGSAVFNNYELVLERWRSEAQQTSIPKATVASSGAVYPNSSANIFNTSYLRLKNLALAYYIPTGILNRLKLGQLKIYAEAQNLITIWDDAAAVSDPESGVLSSAALSRNVPPVKSIVFGLQLSL